MMETKNTMLVYKADSVQVNLLYYGQRLLNPTELLANKQAALGNMLLSYQGQVYLQPALQITHADGNLSTKLVYRAHAVKGLGDNNKQFSFYLNDEHYNLAVTVNYNVYYQEDIIETWVTLKNSEGSAVVLNNLASMYLPVMAEKYYLTQFYGAWFNEMNMLEEELTHGIKTLDSKHGVRTSQVNSPSFMVSLNNPASEDHGELIGGTLAWPGSWQLSFQKTNMQSFTLRRGLTRLPRHIFFLMARPLKRPAAYLPTATRAKGICHAAFTVGQKIMCLKMATHQGQYC
ncbi:MAG: hypothetical protein HC896_05180 [Bacteroidales bacterium]|nr:hypothetical protein [Bacteroidales bacterium]